MAAKKKKPAKKLGKKSLKQTKGGLNFSSLAFKYDIHKVPDSSIKELKPLGNFDLGDKP